MSITKNVTQTVASTQDRTARTQIETALGADPTIEFFRQIVKKDSEGSVVEASNDWTKISRQLSTVANDEVTLSDGTVLSATHMAEAVSKFSDKWRLADLIPKLSAAQTTITSIVNQALTVAVLEDDTSDEDAVFTASGLPAGLSISSANGVINGTPTSTGTATATITATNSYGQGTLTLSFSITEAPQAPAS